MWFYILTWKFEKIAVESSFSSWTCLHFQKSSSRPARHVSIRSVPTFGCSAQLVESRLHGLMPQIDEHWRDTNDFYQPSKPLQNRLGAPVDICSISWSLGITPRIGLSQNVQEKLCWNGRMVTKTCFPAGVPWNQRVASGRLDRDPGDWVTGCSNLADLLEFALPSYPLSWNSQESGMSHVKWVLSTRKCTWLCKNSRNSPRDSKIWWVAHHGLCISIMNII